MELNKTEDFVFFFVHHHIFQISPLLRFLSNMAATRQQCPALLLAEWWNRLWWQRWPIEYRSHWWHNTKTGFFFKTVPRPLFAPYDESSLVPHEDADFLTRCEGHDSQIIWLKQRRLSTVTRVLFSRGSQCGRLAGSLKGERKQYL